MIRVRNLSLALCLLASLPATGWAQTEEPLRAALEDSKANNKGLTFYVNGHAIVGVVVSIGDKYVVARSNAQGTIVLRLDRLDAVAGFVSVERKAP